MIHYDLVYDRKKRIGRDGKALIQIRCHYNNKYKFIGTGIRIRPEHWDVIKQRIRKHPRAGVLNRMIDDQLLKLEDFEIESISKGKQINLSSLEMVLQQSEERKTFNEFLSEELELAPVKPGSKRQLKVFVNKLNEFNPTTYFEDIDIQFCQKFHLFLKSKSLHPNSIAKEFKNFKKFVNIAIDKGHMTLEDYPFRRFKVKKIPSKKTFLTLDEIKSIEDLNLLATPELDQIRDLYLLGVYTGLRFNDLIGLTKESIVKRDGKLWIDLRMKKTEDFVLLPLDVLFHGKPKELINKYVSNEGTILFRRYTNQYVNRCLKVIAQMAEIIKRLNFHSSRHSFGTSLLNMGLPIESVQKLMGHKSLSQTQEYAHMLDLTIEHQLKELNALAS